MYNTRERPSVIFVQLLYNPKGIERRHRVSPAGVPIEQVLGEYSLS